jgi:hypothetical protein
MELDGIRPAKMGGKAFILTPELKKRMAELGLEPLPSSPEEIPEAIQTKLKTEGYTW